MTMQVYRPAPPLDAFVEIFWHAEEPGGAGIERALPTGTVELVFRLSEACVHMPGVGTFGGAVLSGAHSRFFLLDRSQQDLLLGVHFRPGGAFPFFGAPADELGEQQVGLDALWGFDAVSLRDRLAEAPSPLARFRLLEREMRARLADRTRHPVVAFALRELHASPVPLHQLVDKSGYSQRRFIQLFREEVGLTPKSYQRVRRFQNLITAIPQTGDVDWLELALGAGYYDQAHFIHDFRSFSGLSPRGYLARRTGHLNHVDF